ncbi:hypothetical protein GQ53DRAFT_819487 [Thozetella sp. PMI_491]|nr:hypothetical protein GQ53DRAFT_819487 [Thozetella sp. PMI_491]
MSTGSDSHYQFEIVIILVIALIVYVFVSTAWVAGQFLWGMQEKLNRLAIQQRGDDPQSSGGQQSVQKTRPSDIDQQSAEDTAWKLRKERDEATRKLGGLLITITNTRSELQAIELALQNARHDNEKLGTDENANAANTAANARAANAGPENNNFVRDNYDRLDRCRKALEGNASRIERLLQTLPAS